MDNSVNNEPSNPPTQEDNSTSNEEGVSVNVAPEQTTEQVAETISEQPTRLADAAEQSVETNNTAELADSDPATAEGEPVSVETDAANTESSQQILGSNLQIETNTKEQLSEQLKDQPEFSTIQTMGENDFADFADFTLPLLPKSTAYGAIDADDMLAKLLNDTAAKSALDIPKDEYVDFGAELDAVQEVKAASVAEPVTEDPVDDEDTAVLEPDNVCMSVNYSAIDAASSRSSHHTTFDSIRKT